MRRRKFVEAMGAGALGLGFPARAHAATVARLDRTGADEAVRPAPRALRILVLGGTSFLGPHQIRYALDRGHTITIFNRGRTEPRLFRDIFDRVEHIEGDRNESLDALKGRTWDAVIDNSGQRVEWARDAARLLAGSAKHYMYVSSTGVYLPYLTVGIDESVKPVLKDDPPLERPSYGVMKALSEIEVRNAFPNGAIIMRPGYIVGPGDTSDRFPYWPVRLERGGDVLVPGKHGDPVQLIDVRDLTEFMIRLIEDGTTGTFNVVGPSARLSMAEFVYGAAASVSTPIRWHWVDDYDFLEQQKLPYAIPWIMPVGDETGSLSISNAAAKAKGLTFRPLATTVDDTLAWWHSDAVPAERRAKPRFVLTPEREAEILAAWNARGRAGGK
jgi:2'-hydroxyisoflavone reductase